MRPFTTLRTVYSINSSKFDVFTTAGIEIVALDDAVKTFEPDVDAVHNFARANIPFDYVSFYRLKFLLSEKRIWSRSRFWAFFNSFYNFSTSSGSTGKPKIMEFCNKWMGEYPIYTNDVQGLYDILKLFAKFGVRRAMKIVNGKNHIGK